MRPYHIAFLAFVLIASFTGCKTDPNIVLLERENRMLEDEIYRLRGVVQDYEDGMVHPTGAVMTEGTNTSNATGGKTSNVDRKTLPAAEKDQEHPAYIPEVELNTSDATVEVPETFKRPVGLPPPKSATPNKPNTNNPSSMRSPPPLRRVPSPTAGPELSNPASYQDEIRETNASRLPGELIVQPQGDSRQVAQVVLNPQITGSLNNGRKGGDEGVLVALETRDAQGRPLDAPAEVSVVVLDPQLEGDAARIARWDFPADAVASMFRKTKSGPSLMIEAPWPGDPPRHSNLMLFVRYMTSDGRKLHAKQPIEVALPHWANAKQSPQNTDGPSLGQEPGRLDDSLAVPMVARDNGAAPRNAAASYDERRLSGAGAPQTASRASSSTSPRPVWSPERK